MKSFEIHNIKSFVDSGVIEIKPITIFVGKNSCGKSSLIRFLAVLAQTALSRSDTPILFSGNLINYIFKVTVIY
jgi:predicted ATPase